MNLILNKFHFHVHHFIFIYFNFIFLRKLSFFHFKWSTLGQIILWHFSLLKTCISKFFQWVVVSRCLVLLLSLQTPQEGSASEHCPVGKEELAVSSAQSDQEGITGRELSWHDTVCACYSKFGMEIWKVDWGNGNVNCPCYNPLPRTPSL